MRKNPKIRNINPIIGERIETIRKKNNLTVKDFAKVLHVLPCILTRIESGKGTLSITQLVFISNIFDISLDRLCSLDKFVYEPKEIKSFSKSQLKNNKIKNMRRVAGNNILRVRTDYGIDLRTFAAFLKVPVVILPLVEIGIKNISISQITYISRLFEIPMSSLCGKDEFDIPKLDKENLGRAYIYEYFGIRLKKDIVLDVWLYDYEC